MTKLMKRIAKYVMKLDHAAHPQRDAHGRRGGCRTIFIGRNLARIQYGWLHENSIYHEFDKAVD